jgi:adenosine kinase
MLEIVGITPRNGPALVTMLSVTDKPPIIISGSIAIDRIMGFDGRYGDHIRPEKLDSLSISIFLSRLQDSHGGVGANIAYSLALLGESPVLLGSAGPDARSYIEELARLGVNTEHVFESRLPTASFNVITDSDENQVGGFYPGAMFDSKTLSFEPWRDQDPIVVVSPHDPVAMRRQVAESRKWGLRLCYDIGQQVSNLDREEIAEGVEAAHILILNDYEMTALAVKLGRSVDSIKARVPVVVTTLGKDGSLIAGASVPKPLAVGSVKPLSAGDPTGAGDAYRGGFLYGLANGWEHTVCAQLGATCATYAIEQVGTQSHKFTLEDVAKRYTAAFGSGLPVRATEV